MGKQSKTSWESSARWYDETVGEKGHYYHDHVIFPNLLPLMNLNKQSKVLDLGCGQGVLERKLPLEVSYFGVDASPSLIKLAKGRAKKGREFLAADLTKPLVLPQKDFTHALFLLSLQNMEEIEIPFKTAFHHLAKEGKLFLVLNHPCFRIPRQTHWGIDEEKKLQYRRVDSYLSPQKIPIQTHPGKQEGVQTFSFHSPLSFYAKTLKQTGFCIESIEEWISDKTSTGGRAKMENRARKEFPLFLTLVCKKLI